MRDTSKADASNAAEGPSVGAPQSHLALVKHNGRASDGIPDKPAIAAQRSAEIESESSNTPGPNRAKLDKLPPTHAIGVAMFSSHVNDYYAAVVLIASIVLLALLPSGVPAKRASVVDCPERETDFETRQSLVRQELDALHDVDSEIDESPRSTVPVASAFAAGVTPLSLKAIFMLNFVLWVSLAMGFSAYAKGYLRKTREPIGLLVLQGTIGIAVLGLSLIHI